MNKLLMIAGLAAIVSGCSSTFGQCPTGQTAVSVDAGGNLVYDKVTTTCQAPAGSFKSLSDGPMKAPLPGKGFTDLFK